VLTDVEEATLRAGRNQLRTKLTAANVLIAELRAEAEQLRKAAGDRPVIEAAITSWEDGEIAPHDALVAIRDQLRGRIPGVDDEEGASAP
jgi:hypothetical protein